MTMLIAGPDRVRGRVRLWQVQDCEERPHWKPRSGYLRNLLLNQWSTVVAKLLSSGDARYRIGGMYLEFENTASPGDQVTPPTFDRTRDISYYNDLAGSSSRDYLRVPLTATQLLSAGDGFTDNQLIIFARSAGTTGVHGKPFSDAANSVVFGASLVAFVEDDDPTRDLLLNSIYFNQGDQQQKLATSQVGIEWELTLQ